MQQGWTGKTLAGRYQIDDLVGHGGMSSVYKATDSNLKRVVAIKVIHPHLTGDGEFLRRFETEAEAIAQLRHSNVIQVFDFNHEEDSYYMVMEFVPGESLQERLRRLNESGRRLSADEIVKIATSVCGGADYAHKRGMIHRDIKPANVMLSVQGDAILTDFGLAKIAGTTQHTAAGAVMGTALYMSPEQIRGEQVDARTDIYALGVTLFEMLSGRPPYTADSAMTVLMMHLNDPLPDLRQLNPELPESLVAVVEKAMAKNPSDRYGSAAEMADALRAAADQPQATAAAPVPPPADATVVARPGDAGGASPPSPPPEATAVHRPEPETPSPVGGTTSPPPPIPPAAERTGDGFSGVPPWMFAVAGVAAVVVIVVVLLVAGVFGGGDDDGAVVAGSPTASPGAQATNGSQTTEAPSAEPTEAPTAAPTQIPLTDGHVRINDITLSGGSYVVEYETAGYTEAQNDTHIHFFFDTVPPEQAGVPNDGPWFVWYGPRPFDGYSQSDRPQGATEICALTANADHSVNLGTGNCVPLPDA